MHFNLSIMCPSFVLKASILICLQLSVNVCCTEGNSSDPLLCDSYFLVLTKQRKSISCKYYLSGKENTTAGFCLY